MPNWNAIIIVDCFLYFFYMVAMHCSNVSFACALKLKNSNCGINPLMWVTFYAKINNVSQYAW